MSSLILPSFLAMFIALCAHTSATKNLLPYASIIVCSFASKNPTKSQDKQSSVPVRQSLDPVPIVNMQTYIGLVVLLLGRKCRLHLLYFDSGQTRPTWRHWSLASRLEVRISAGSWLAIRHTASCSRRRAVRTDTSAGRRHCWVQGATVAVWYEMHSLRKSLWVLTLKMHFQPSCRHTDIRPTFDLLCAQMMMSNIGHSVYRMNQKAFIFSRPWIFGWLLLVYMVPNFQTSLSLSVCWGIWQ